MVWRHRDGTDQATQTPALQIVHQEQAGARTTSCVCLACGETWHEGQLQFLGQVLEQELAAGPPRRLTSLAVGATGRPGHEPQAGPGWQLYTDADREHYRAPRCPNCQSTADVEWIDVRRFGDEESSFIPGMHSCRIQCGRFLSDPQWRAQLHRRYPGWRFGVPSRDTPAA